MLSVWVFFPQLISISELLCIIVWYAGKKNNAVIQAIVAIMTTFGHTKKSHKKNAVIQAIVAIVTTIGHT